jgi:phage I-like protein
MAYDHNSILKAQGERIAADQARAIGELEEARLNENSYAAMDAAQRILELDAQQAALVKRTQQYVAARQAQPQGNQYGLTKDEVEAAEMSGISEEEYLRNKQKYHAKLASGEMSRQYK